MRLPTERDIHQLFERVRQTNTRDLETRLVNHLHEETRRRNAIDGYPRQVLQGPHGSSELTPTEATAEALLALDSDGHHGNFEQALGFLLDGVGCLGALETRIGKMDAANNDPDATISAATECEPCAATGQHHEYDHTGTAGWLDDSIAMCGPVYKFVRDHHRLPDDGELGRYHLTGRWRVRTTA